jgi:hypothetical protein
MKKLLYIIIAAVALASCHKEECLDCNFSPVYPKAFTRIYFHYMAMDNTLAIYADQNIDAMVQGATKESLAGGAIFVLRDVPGVNTRLIMIYWDELAGKVQKAVVRDYGANLDTSDPEVLKGAIAYVDQIADAPSWALGFGSHGMGWVPAVAYDKYFKPLWTNRSMAAVPAGNVLTRFLVDDGSVKFMEMDVFAEAVDDSVPREAGANYDFILMDLCYMGSIEFAYQMRNTADYLILSPAEIIAEGMPYDQIVGDIFAEDVRAGVGEICRKFYEFYDNYESPSLQYATISLVDCSKFRPMTDAMRELVAGKEAQIGAMDVDALKSEGWCYDRFPGTYNGVVLTPKPITFDMKKFVDELGGHAGFEAALAELVPYRETTGKTLMDRIPITIAKDKFCGLSTYIPAAKYGTAKDDLPSLNEYYRLTGWSQAVYQ